MARVFLALSGSEDGFAKLLVLKVLRTELIDAEYTTMFLQEARLAARLNHPNVVQTYEVGQDGERRFMAMEYLEGQTLATLTTSMGDVGGLPLPMHVSVLRDVLEGLHYAHQLVDYDGTPLSVVHRDVSPQNVFVTYAGQAKILDFGIAKVRGSQFTSNGVIKGKVGYMAPEQVLGEHLDARCDVYAVGVMLWEALSGKRRTDPKSEDITILTRRVSGGEPRIREVTADADPLLAEICDKALAVRRDDRFASAAEMRDALEGWLGTQERADPRRLNALLERQFAEERVAIRKLVDDQIKKVDLSEEIVDIRTQRTITPPSGRSDRKQVLEATNATRPGLAPPSTDVETVAVPAPRLSPVATLPQVAVLTTASATARGAPWALGLVLVLIAGAALWRFSARREPPTEPGVAVPVTAQTPPPPADSPGHEPRAAVVVSIEAEPRSAILVLDGKPLADNPFHASLPADERTHELKVNAEGYEPEVSHVSLGADLNVIVRLLPKSTARRAGAEPRRHGAAPAMADPKAPDQAHPQSHATVTDLGHGPGTRALDWADPWAK